MKQTYEIDLSTKGITELQKGLKEYDKWLKKKTNELCRRLARLGVDRARVYFAESLYDGINDAKVHSEKRENGYAVVADGNTVLFIEFGAGVHYPDDHPEGAENGMIHGTFGEQGKNDYWFYTGQPGNAGGELAYGHKNTTITHGNPANMPMWKAMKDVGLELEEVVREVFSK